MVDYLVEHSTALLLPWKKHGVKTWHNAETIWLQPKTTRQPESLAKTKAQIIGRFGFEIQTLVSDVENFSPDFCSAAAWHTKCSRSCISVFESVQADGEVVCMVEEASPVWCTNGLVTRNHNVMKSNDEPQPNSYNHDAQTNEGKKKSRTSYQRFEKKELCGGSNGHKIATYVWKRHLKLARKKKTCCVRLYKTREIQIHKCLTLARDRPAFLWVEVLWVKEVKMMMCRGEEEGLRYSIL